MQWKSLVALCLAASQAHAFLRFSCSQLVTERLDPLVNPGVTGSPHLHQIVGGNSFEPSMDPAKDPSQLSTCTTCTFSEDFSNYWTAVLFFKAANGSFKRVPQVPGHYLGNANGGMTVYYIQGEGFNMQNASMKVTTFKKGFRMLVGDPTTRTYNKAEDYSYYSRSTYRCFDARRSQILPYPGQGFDTNLDSNTMPKQVCPGGIRAQIYFPTCWDGVNQDSPDHRSHVAFYTKGTSKCPSTHPVYIPQVMYEATWDTSSFNSLWKSGDPNPFVWSTGDGTGLGQHADYLFGWQGDALQRAMDKCTGAGGACQTLKTQSVDVGNRCTKKSVVGEDTDAWLTKLPGDNPVTYA